MAAKTQIILQLLASIKPKDGKPSHGITNELATQHNCSRKTISRLWREIKKQRQEGGIIDIQHKNKGVPNIRKIAFDEEKF